MSDVTEQERRAIAAAFDQFVAWQAEMTRRFQAQQLRAALPQKPANNRKGRRAAQAAKR